MATQQTLCEQARELAGMSVYSSEYQRKSPAVLRALAQEVERLYKAVDRADDLIEGARDWYPQDLGHLEKRHGEWAGMPKPAPAITVHW
jgi:hypothetical protein